MITIEQAAHDNCDCNPWTCPYCAAERGERNDSIQWYEEWDDEESRNGNQE